MTMSNNEVSQIIKNMSEQERHQFIVQSVKREVLLSSDFEFCKKYYQSFAQLFPECKETIIRKLLELSIVEGAFVPAKIQDLIELFGKSIWTRFLSSFFQNFDDAYLSYYQACSPYERIILSEECVRSSIQNCTAFCILEEVYPVIVQLFPNDKELIDSRLFDLCIAESDFKEVYQENFIKLVGKKEKHAKKLLVNYLLNTILHLLVSSLLLIGVVYSLLFLSKIIVSTFGIVCFSLIGIPLCLALVYKVPQYIIRLFLAISNFFRTKSYHLNRTTLVYRKNRDGSMGASVVKDIY